MANLNAIPIKFDIPNNVYVYTPPNSDITPQYPTTRHTLYLPIHLLQTFQLKPGSWIPLIITHSQQSTKAISIKNNNDDGNGDDDDGDGDDIYTSSQFHCVAQIQPLIHGGTLNNPVQSIGSILSSLDSTMITPTQNEQQCDPTPILPPTSPLAQIPTLNHPLYVSPSLFSHLLMAIKSYSLALSSSPTIMINPIRTQHYLVASTLAIAASPKTPHPHTLYQSTLITTPLPLLLPHLLVPKTNTQLFQLHQQSTSNNTNENTFPQYTKPHIIPSLNQLGYFVDQSMTYISSNGYVDLDLNKTSPSTMLTFAYYSSQPFNNQGSNTTITPNDDDDNTTTITTTTTIQPSHSSPKIQFQSLYSILSTIKPHLEKKLWEQAERESYTRKLALTDQVLTINTFQYLFSTIYNRLLLLSPTEKPSTQNHTTIKQTKGNKGGKDKGDKSDSNSKKSTLNHIINNNGLITPVTTKSYPDHCSVVETCIPIEIDLINQGKSTSTKPSSTQLTRLKQGDSESPTPTVFPTSNLINQLATYWSNEISIGLKAYKNEITPLLYNLLATTTTPLQSQRIIPILITGGVGSGKTLFLQQLACNKYGNSTFFDLGNENLLTLYHTLSSLFQRLAQRLTQTISYPSEVLSTPSSKGSSSSHCSIVIKEPLIYMVCFDNLDILFSSNHGESHLKRAKYEIIQLILSFINATPSLNHFNHLMNQQQNSNTITLYPTISFIFTSRQMSPSSSSSSSSSSTTSTPHAHQALQQLQTSQIYQDFCSSFHLKFHFKPLTIPQRVEILSHYLRLIKLSFHSPIYDVLCQKHMICNGSDNNGIPHDDYNLTNGYTTCPGCSNIAYPTNITQKITTSNTPGDENDNNETMKQHVITKEDIVTEWARTLHGCSPAVLQQLCSLAIVAAYKRHYGDDSGVAAEDSDKINKIDPQFFNKNTLCLSHIEWSYAINLCKLYYAIPHNITPSPNHFTHLNHYLITTHHYDSPAAPNVKLIPLPSLINNINPIIRQYYAGYLPQLIQLMSLFHSTQQQGQNHAGNPFNSSNLLISGPTGTGKSQLVNLISLMMKLKVISIDIASLTSKFQGGSNVMVRDIFNQAKANSPCILLFENIDTFVIRKRVTIARWNEEQKIMSGSSVNTTNQKKKVKSGDTFQQEQLIIKRLTRLVRGVMNGSSQGNDKQESPTNPRVEIEQSQQSSIKSSSLSKSFKAKLNQLRAHSRLSQRASRKANHHQGNAGDEDQYKMIPYCNPILENILKYLDHIAYTKQSHYEQFHSITQGSDNNNNKKKSDVKDASMTIHGIPSYITNPTMTSNAALFTYPQELSDVARTQTVKSNTSNNITTTNNNDSSIIIIATTQLPPSQLPTNLITSTRFLHSIELNTPGVIELAQIFALLISKKPFIPMSQYFSTAEDDIKLNQNQQFVEEKIVSHDHNITPLIQFESTILPCPLLDGTISIKATTPTTTSLLTEKKPDEDKHTTKPDEEILSDHEWAQLFPTYQHIALFVAMYVGYTPSVIANDEENIPVNTNLSTTKRPAVSPATISAIIDVAVMDAVRDNIKAQHIYHVNDTSDSIKTNHDDLSKIEDKKEDFLLPLRPKNIIIGLKTICSYRGDIKNDLVLVNQHLDAMAVLVLGQIDDFCDEEPSNNNTITIGQQTTFSLPDCIEEFNMMYS